MADEQQTPPAPEGWWSKLEEADRGFVTNRGWDKLDPGAAAAEALKAYRGSEKLRGGLASGDVVALPKQGDAEGAKEFWKKVGTPEKPEGYNFEGLQTKAGVAPEEGYLAAARAAAHATNMPAHMLREFMGHMQPWQDGIAERQQAQLTVDVQQQDRDLQLHWGANTPRNKFIAARAMDTMNVSAEAIATADRAMGHVPFMDMFLEIGNLLGESRFVGGGGPVGTMTADQAAARREQLMADEGFRARWIKNGKQGPEGQEMSDLIRIMSQGR
jgi:hypothetical protein